MIQLVCVVVGCVCAQIDPQSEPPPAPSPSPAVTPIPARTVTATVVFRSDDGEPIAGLPLAIRSERDVQGGTTDEHGRLQRDIEVDPAETSVHVVAYTYRWSKDPSDSGQIADMMGRIDTCRSIQSKHAIPERHILRLTPEQREVLLDFRASKTISVTLKALDSTDKPVEAVVGSEFGIMLPIPRPDATKGGAITLPGIAADRPIRVCVISEFGAVKVVEAPAAATDVDLGVAKFDSPSIAKLKLEIDDTTDTERQVDWKRDYLGWGMTIISASGEFVDFSGWLEGEEGKAILMGTCPGVDQYEQHNLICVPGGDFWILPGEFVGEPIFFDLLDRIRSGQSLGDAAIRVTAIAGQTVEVKVPLAKLIGGWKALGID